MQIYNEKVTEIRKTNDYGLFTSILGNRNLNDKNYRKLVNSMQEEQLMIPILVSNNEEGDGYCIIDGQHRFEAAKLLNLSVFYYVVEGYTIEQVKRANLVSCNWQLHDFMNLNVSLQKTDYINFNNLIFKYKLRVAQLLEIISNIEDREFLKVKQSFELGEFEFENYMAVYQFLEDLQDFSEFDLYTSTKFTKAFIRLYIYENYDHKIMQKKLKNLSYKLVQRPTFREYLSLIVNDIYVYGSSTIGFKYDINANRFYDLK